MIDHPILFATINIISAALAVSGGILGLFSFLYIRQRKEFIEFLVNHLGTAARHSRKKEK